MHQKPYLTKHKKHRLATTHNVTDGDRQTDETL